MEQFKKKFLEEANELIVKLESILLEMEDNPNDSSIIEEVFRVMHSLKGGSAMFGFHLMDAFTHELETVYDLIRSGQLKVNREILDVTLSSVDHLKSLLDAGEELNSRAKKNHAVLLSKIKGIVSATIGGTGEQISDTEDGFSIFDDEPSASVVITEDFPTWFIKVSPREDIFQNGTNPFLLIDELNSLGHARVYPKWFRLPAFNDLNPERCFLAWELFLSTDKTENDIRDVFIFVEDECDLEISKISEINLLTNKTFHKEVDALVMTDGFTEVNVLNSLVQKSIEESTAEDLGNFKAGDISSYAKDSAISSIRVSSDKLDDLMNLVSELITTQASLSLFAENNHMPGLSVISENIEKISRRLRDNTFEICLIPIETIMVRFKRLVRDLSSELNKDIQFVAEGTETELDKSIIEGLTEPLMHIFRNAIDHGLESAEERLKKGKPKQGKIILKAFYSGANVYLQIKDDGAGIDVEKIRHKAINRGFISPEANLSYKELLHLVFLPGFSTAAKVTELSGRGVGLDVVVKKISDIRGEVEIESQLGVGTTITIKLPLTLSIIDGLLVKIDQTHFVLPLSSVDKCFEVSNQEIKTVFNNKLTLDAKKVPFVNLREEFDIQSEAPDYVQIIQTHYEDYKVGISVDVVIGEYQAVLKPLGRMFKNQEIISGATILGDGTIALVLDPGKIISTFDRETLIKREKFYKNLGKRKDLDL